MLYPSKTQLDLSGQIDQLQNLINDRQEEVFKMKIRLRELKEEYFRLRSSGKAPARSKLVNR
jgi:hypothetical protein